MKKSGNKGTGSSQRIMAQYMVLGGLVAFILVAVNIPSVAEGYSRYVYRPVAFVTGGFASLFPFVSVYDLFLTLLAAALVILVSLTIAGRFSAGRSGGIFLRAVLWLVMLFYFCWGMNYFRPGFYQRYGLEPPVATPDSFEKFAFDFISEMNEAWPDRLIYPEEKQYEAVKNGYAALEAPFRLPGYLIRTPKYMLYSRLMAGMGIKGYIGVYFNEATVNRFLLPGQYAFTVAHELAHTLGVAGEAEANFYAFLVCSRSPEAPLRFSAYISVLPYLLGNARRVLPPERYESLTCRIRPDIQNLYTEERIYWHKLYYPAAGKIQDKLYDLFLRSNRIEAGRKDYYGVIAYLMAARQHGYCQ